MVTYTDSCFWIYASLYREGSVDLGNNLVFLSRYFCCTTKYRDRKYHQLKCGDLQVNKCTNVQMYSCTKRMRQERPCSDFSFLFPSILHTLAVADLCLHFLAQFLSRKVEVKQLFSCLVIWGLICSPGRYCDDFALLKIEW